MKGPTRHSYTEVEVMHRRRCTSNSMDVSECLASHHHLFQSCMRPKTHTTGDVNTNSAWCGRWVLLVLIGSHLLLVVHLCMPNALGYSGVHTGCEGDCLALSSEYCSLAYMLAWSIKTFLLLKVILNNKLKLLSYAYGPRPHIFFVSIQAESWSGGVGEKRRSPGAVSEAGWWLG